MTTPRIEEMVEEGQKIVCDYLDEVRRLLAGLPGEVKPHMFTKWLRQSLTQAHQAGIDEAVEIMEKQKNKWERRPAWKEHYRAGYSQALDDTIKALTDNK